MKRRRFLIGAAATAAGLLTPGTNRSQPGINLRLAVSSEDPGQAIALDFIGLSYESAILAGGDYFTPNNSSALGLMDRSARTASSASAATRVKSGAEMRSLCGLPVS
jgi:hypothetical protein